MAAGGLMQRLEGLPPRSILMWIRTRSE